MPETPDPTPDHTTDHTTERLSRLDLGPVTPSMDAAAVRGAGDRRRRRTTAAIAGAAALAVVAVVTPVALALGGPDGDVEPTGPLPVHRGGTTSTIPDDFPITDGLLGPTKADADGPADALKPWATPDLCGSEAWPVAGDDELSYAEGGGEYYRSRVLVTYPDVHTAVTVIDDLRAALGGCAQSTDEVGNTYDNADVPPTTDADSLTWSSVLASGQPAGTIYQFVRVGSAVLATADSAEWTATSARDGATQLTYDNLGVVDAMCAFTRRGCPGD